MPWTIRDAAPDDHDELQEVRRRSSLSNDGDRALLEAHPEVLVLAADATEPGRTRVAVDDADNPVGFSSMSRGEDALELDALFADPEWMGRGVGHALVNDVVEIARARGVAAVEVTGNDHTLAFYLRQGFEVIGVVDTPLGVPASRLRREI